MSSLTVAAIQTQPVFGEIQHNITRAIDLIPGDCDLVVLPELFASGYQFTSRDEAVDLAENLTGDSAPDSACARLGKVAQSTNTTIVAGLAEISGNKLYNSAVLLRPDGTREIYRKIHLFWDEKSIFDPGDLGFPVFEACGTKIGLMVCFDWLFPESARTLALAGAKIICHPSNLVLPWCPEAMITRCLENRVFAITSNRVGNEHRQDPELNFIGKSQIVSPLGERKAALGTLETGVAKAAIDLKTTAKQITPQNNIWTDRRTEFYSG